MSQRTHCPTCGAKIARADLSICSYCLTPLSLGSERKPRDGATAQRLAKMRDHPEFKAAEAWDPPEGLEYRSAARRQSLGLAAVVLAGACAVYAAIRPSAGSATDMLTSVPGIAAIALIGAGVALWVAGNRERGRILALPLLKRPALVTSRRSETSADGGGQTIYSFTLEFEDGAEGEFRFRGLGASHDPLVAGNLGIAYTRRETLLAFRLIRV
jgi:hypothetical protein